MGRTILILVGVILFVVAISGCTSNNTETLLMNYTLPSGEYPNYMGVQNVVIPNGTKSVKIEYINLTKVDSSKSLSNLNVYFLNAIPVSEQSTSNYAQSTLSQKVVNINNTVSGIFDFNSTQIKGLIIVNNNAKGLIKIYIS